MIDESFCAQVGTEKQHRYACLLASKAGYKRLRDAVSDALNVSVSKCGKSNFVITVKDASQVIDYLKKKAE
jgi:hypothetical protein